MYRRNETGFQQFWVILFRIEASLGGKRLRLIQGIVLNIEQNIGLILSVVQKPVSTILG